MPATETYAGRCTHCGSEFGSHDQLKHVGEMVRCPKCGLFTRSDRKPRRQPRPATDAERRRGRLLGKALIWTTGVVLVGALLWDVAQYDPGSGPSSVVQPSDPVRSAPAAILELARTARTSGNYIGAFLHVRTLMNDYAGTAEGDSAAAFLVELQRDTAEVNAKERDAKRAADAAIARLRKRVDGIEGVTWYRDPSSPALVSERSAIYAYIGEFSPSARFLRMRIQYVADNWLFIRRFVIQVDGKNYRIEPGYADVERDHYTKIWEWYDTDGEPHLSMLKAIAASTRTVIRHEGGQYYRDRTVTTAEKQALRNVLVAFGAGP